MGNIVQTLPLNGADHDILTPFPAAPALIEHAHGLAHAWGVAEEDLEAAARVVRFLGRDLAEEFLGIGAAEFFRGHYGHQSGSLPLPYGRGSEMHTEPRP